MRAAWLVVVVCSLTSAAAAESEAEKYFNEGRKRLEAGDLAAACDAFANSQRAEAKPGTLLNLADCEERRGFAATARATFLQAKALAHTLGDHRREAEADRRLAALEPRLATLTVVITSDRVVDGMVVKRNGSQLDASIWNTPVPADPGHYTIEVSAPGRRTWTKDYMLGDREHALIAVEPLQPLPPGAAVAEPGTAGLATIVRPHTLAVGATVGVNVQREAGVFGVRVSRPFAAPGGELRAIGGFSVSRYADDPLMDTYRTTTYSFLASVEYRWSPTRVLALGGGLGVGADYDVATPHMPPDRINDIGGLFTIGAAPVVLRLRDGTVELGLHLAALIAGDEVTVSSTVALDWFLW